MSETTNETVAEIIRHGIEPEDYETNKWYRFNYYDESLKLIDTDHDDMMITDVLSHYLTFIEENISYIAQQTPTKKSVIEATLKPALEATRNLKEYGETSLPRVVRQAAITDMCMNVVAYNDMALGDYQKEDVPPSADWCEVISDD